MLAILIAKKSLKTYFPKAKKKILGTTKSIHNLIFLKGSELTHLNKGDFKEATWKEFKVTWTIKPAQ